MDAEAALGRKPPHGPPRPRHGDVAASVARVRRRASIDQSARETGEDGDRRPSAGRIRSHLEETQGQIERLKQVFEKLSGLAEGGINQSAADAAHPDDDEDPVAAGASTLGRLPRRRKLGAARARRPASWS